MMPLVENRLSRTKVTGLPLTIFVTTALYFVWLYLSSALDFDRHGIINDFDVVTTQFFLQNRTPARLQIFTFITAFGSWSIVVALAIAVSALLWLNGRQQYLMTLWLVLAGNQISVTLIKVIFARSRPELAYYSEASYSFPSGHSAVSAAFFGFVFYIILKERILPAGLSVASAFLVMVLIGTSRLVLGEHYVSDVLHGYLVGALWLLLGTWVQNPSISVAERQPIIESSRLNVFAHLYVIVIGAASIWILVMFYVANLNILTF